MKDAWATRGGGVDVNKTYRLVHDRAAWGAFVKGRMSYGDSQANMKFG